MNQRLSIIFIFEKCILNEVKIVLIRSTRDDTFITINFNFVFKNNKIKGSIKQIEQQLIQFFYN